MEDKDRNKYQNLLEIASLFFKLGFSSFGGAPAQVAMIEKEVVEKRKWMTFEKFFDLVGFSNIIPGSTSTQLAINCGLIKGGRVGLWVAGISFVLPSILITLFIAALYSKFGMHSHARTFFELLKPPIFAIIFVSVYKLGIRSIKTVFLFFTAVFVCYLTLLGINEVEAIFIVATFASIIIYAQRKKASLNTLVPLSFINLSTLKFLNFSNTSLFLSLNSLPINPNNILAIFTVFFKISLTLFGGGFVLFAYLDGELVDHNHWITHKQVVDAIAVGQFTPGPFLSTATFIGFQLHGVLGALAATIGIFFPPFILGTILNPLLPKIRTSEVASLFLDVVNVCAVGVMMEVTFKFAKNISINYTSIIVAIFCAFIALKFSKVNSFWIIILGFILGYILELVFKN